MFNGLEGKSAIVTGGSTLIGAGVVRALHAAGVKVVIADIDAANGQALADALGEGACFVRTDITDDAQVAACVEQARSRHGGVHILVNLACSYVDEGLQSPRADWLASFNVNVASAVAMLQAVHPHMKAAGGGAVVNFTSISSEAAQTGRWLYPASKAAMKQLTRSMAMNLAADGLPPAGPRGRSARGGPGGAVPVLGPRQLRDGGRLRGRRRLWRHGPRAGRGRHSPIDGLSRAQYGHRAARRHSHEENRHRRCRPVGPATGPGPAGRRP
jgi:NAD(P)-dependent dehydrogenase (short-subunit alcohol dehydrogenase family)